MREIDAQNEAANEPNRLTALTLLGVLAPGLASPLRLAAWAGAVLLLGVAWVSPMSPGALQWADAALGLGRPDLAADHYERVARWTPFRAHQREALARGALVAAVELGNPVRARRQLEWLGRITEAEPARASIKEQIAGLLIQERQFLEAARLLREAHDTCLTCTTAPRRLVRAAELVADHGEAQDAIELFARVVERYPAHRAKANIGRAELLLARGEALEALVLFEDASERTFDADLQALAKLGVATCLERLGNLDEALAELDAADLPPQVRRTRREGMEARRP